MTRNAKSRVQRRRRAMRGMCWWVVALTVAVALQPQTAPASARIGPALAFGLAVALLATPAVERFNRRVALQRKARRRR